MDWEKEFMEICIKNNICPILGVNNERLLVVPKMPPKDIQQKIRDVVPSEVFYKYVEAPNPATAEGLKILFRQLGVRSATLENKNHCLIIEVTGDNPLLMDQDSNLWEIIEKLISIDEYIEECKIMVNDQPSYHYDRKMKRALASRSSKIERMMCPSEEEIMDLRIALGMSKDVNDFIAQL